MNENFFTARLLSSSTPDLLEISAELMWFRVEQRILRAGAQEKELSDEEIAGYLNDETNARHIQHALSRIEERIEMGDPTVKKFYPQVIALTKSPVGEIRKTTAWVMGQDNSVEEFHRALAGLLEHEGFHASKESPTHFTLGNDADYPEESTPLSQFR